MEHRWGQRHQMILRVNLATSGRPTAMGWLTNISISGAYLTTAGTFSIMNPVTIEVAEPHEGHALPAPLQLQGRIVRHGATGIAVEWEQFASETLARIIRIATSVPGYRTNATRHGSSGAGSWTLSGYDTSSEGQALIES